MPLNFDDLIPSDQSESPQAVAFDDLVPQQSQQQGGGFLDTIGKYLWQQTPEAKAVAEGVRKTIAGFVPTSISGAAQMATPVVGGVEDIVRGGKSLIDLSKGKSIDEITREHYPEAYRYENFKDKPLEEKAQLISGDIANALMAGGIAKGLIKAGTAEPSPLADRIGAINDELAKGFQPESVTFDDLIPKSETPSVAAEPSTQTRPTSGIPESPEATTTGDIAAGQQPVEPERGIGVGQPAPQGIVAPTGEPVGTSNRIFEQTYGEGVIPSGIGADTGQLLDNARIGIRDGSIDPYSVLSQTRQTGIATPEQFAPLAVEHERLVNEAIAKEKAGDPTAPQAMQQAEDFANAIQPHKTAASNLMRLFQGELNYDLSSPFGMEQYMKSELGRGMTEAERPKFTQRAREIDQAQNEVPQSVSSADAKVQRSFGKVRDIPIEEAAARVKEWLKDCQV